MKIIQLDKTCFKVSIFLTKTKEKADVLIDPFDESIISKVKASILLFTEKKEKKDYQRGEAFLIDGPGEYEIKGIFVRGIRAQGQVQKDGGEDIIIYTIKAEGMTVCYLGSFGQKELSPEQIDGLGSIDVLIMPIGEFLSSKEMQKIISQIEPKTVIPVQHDGEKLKKKMEEFLNEMGAKDIEEKEQIVLKKKESEEDGAKVILLKREKK